jgi:hypothetical protein
VKQRVHNLGEEFFKEEPSSSCLRSRLTWLTWCR